MSNPKDRAAKNKVKLSLVPSSALIRMAVAFEEGADKYGPFNWRKDKVQATIYCDAILRHLLAYIDGQDIDPESGKHHLDGVLASAAILTDARETGTLIDNRPIKGCAAELLENLAVTNDSGILKNIQKQEDIIIHRICTQEDMEK